MSLHVHHSIIPKTMLFVCRESLTVGVGKVGQVGPASLPNAGRRSGNGSRSWEREAYLVEQAKRAADGLAAQLVCTRLRRQRPGRGSRQVWG